MSRYIPPELIPNILARLPVKDVLRCTAVCKSWYSLITSPSFTSLHLELSTPDQTPSLLFTYKVCSTYRQTYITISQNQILEEIPGPDHPWTHNTFNVVGSFNGLFLLDMEYDDMTILFNPSLRKSVTLPNPNRPMSKGYGYKLGFCYLPATNDYKVVRFSYGRKVKGQIYELSTRSWRNIKNANSIPFHIDSSTQVVLKDVIHWESSNRCDYYQTLIGSFNMKNEKFGTLMLPNMLQYERNLFITLFTFEESLCFIHTKDGCFVVWVMKEYGVADSWTKQFNIDFGYYVRPIYCWENGEILVGPYRNSNNRTAFVVYDFIKQKEIKDITASDQGGVNIMADNYMESLVFD